MCHDDVSCVHVRALFDRHTQWGPGVLPGIYWAFQLDSAFWKACQHLEITHCSFFIIWLWQEFSISISGSRQGGGEEEKNVLRMQADRQLPVPAACQALAEDCGDQFDSLIKDFHWAFVGATVAVGWRLPVEWNVKWQVSSAASSILWPWKVVVVSATLWLWLIWKGLEDPLWLMRRKYKIFNWSLIAAS